MSDAAYVLDASAVLALILREQGSDIVGGILPVACISAVNASEVVAKLAERGASADEIRASLDELNLDIRDYTPEQAMLAGLMRPETRAFGLSLGDRACLALAKALGVEAVTTDAAWARIDLPARVLLAR